MNYTISTNALAIENKKSDQGFIYDLRERVGAPDGGGFVDDRCYFPGDIWLVNNIKRICETTSGKMLTYFHPDGDCKQQ